MCRGGECGEAFRATRSCVWRPVQCWCNADPIQKPCLLISTCDEGCKTRAQRATWWGSAKSSGCSPRRPVPAPVRDAPQTPVTPVLEDHTPPLVCDRRCSRVGETLKTTPTNKGIWLISRITLRPL